jgi:hypothetical protein
MTSKWVRSIIHPTSSSPNVIAIILGPLSSHPHDRMMEHIGRMYTNGGNNQNHKCTVIMASSPPFQFLLNRNLQPIAQEVLRQTSMALSQSSSDSVVSTQQSPPPMMIPIVVHSFSNGGAFLLEAIERELLCTNDNSKNIQQQPNSSISSKCTTHNEKYEMIRRGMNIGYQFFDSCPCYIRTLWDTTSNDIDWRKSFPHENFPFLWVRYLYTWTSALALSSWCIMTFAWHRPQEFWNHMLHSTICTNHQIFMYTTCDLLTDAAAIDRFIDTRRRQYGDQLTCTVYRYHDSNHCQFYIDHPNEYQTAINDALASVIKINRPKSNPTKNVIKIS